MRYFPPVATNAPFRFSRHAGTDLPQREKQRESEKTERERDGERKKPEKKKI